MKRRWFVVVVVAAVCTAAIAATWHRKAGPGEAVAPSERQVANGADGLADEVLIHRLAAFRLSDQQKHGSDAALVEAAKELGVRRSVAAVPALVNAVSLMQRVHTNTTPSDWVNGDPPLTSFAVSVAALRHIGEPAVGPILDRLAKISGPDPKAFNQDRYLLEQSLLGIVGKDRAIALAQARLAALSGDEHDAMQTVVTTLGWTNVEG